MWCLEAQYKVGYYYDHGIVVEVDKERALDLYKMAAKEGNNNAQKSLAYLYEQSEETETNLDDAIYWYKKAIDNGCQESKKRLDNLLKQQNIWWNL